MLGVGCQADCLKLWPRGCWFAPLQPVFIGEFKVGQIGDAVNKVEFVAFYHIEDGKFPIPGIRTELYGGDDQPKIQATLVAVNREPHPKENRYRCQFVTSDPRMIALSERCKHDLAVDRGYCIRCNIVPV